MFPGSSPARNSSSLRDWEHLSNLPALAGCARGPVGKDRAVRLLPALTATYGKRPRRYLSAPIARRWERPPTLESHPPPAAHRELERLVRCAQGPRENRKRTGSD